jgi:hypothetical protein
MSSDVVPPNETLCPHFERVDEKTLEELFTKVAKVRSDNKELFDFTHRKITVFDTQSDATLTEDEVYSVLNRDRTGNFAVVIEGNVGTGKSELCAYLSLRLQEDDRPVLHIDKDADLLSIMAEEIPDFYETHIGGELPSASNIERLQENVRNNRQTVATLVVAKAKLKVGEKADTSVDLSESQTGKLEEFVEEKLVALAERGDFATKVSFVEPSEIKQFDYLDVFDEKDRETAAEQWNDAIWESVREEYDTPSLDKLLKTVGQAFGDTRPVIVFEDFSISSLDADKLVRYMEEYSGEHKWDFIVAGTQDSTEVLRTQTGLERHEFYRTNRPNSNSVLFLDRESAVDFIRPFLAYIKHADGSVAYRRNDDNEIEELLPPESGSICDRCGFCDDAFRDMFPFNETFLQRIFDGLDEEDQRPRQYVQKVFSIVYDYSSDYVLAPSSSDELEGIDNSVILTNDVYGNDDVRRLAKWYGTETDGGNIEVDRRFARAFGLDDADFEELDIAVEDSVLIVPTPDGEETVTVESTDETTQMTTTRDTKSKEEQKIEELKGSLDNWRSDPTQDSVASLDVYLRTGINDTMKRLTDGFKLQSAGALEYLVGGESNPIVYEGYEMPDDTQIEIGPEDFAPEDLIELLRFGVYREMDPRSADYESVFDQLGTQLTGYAEAWRDAIRGATIDISSNFYQISSTNRGFEEFVIGTYGTIVMLDDPWTEVTSERIAEAYHADSTPTIDAVLDEALEDRLMADEYEQISDFVAYADHLEDLVGDYFGVSANALDRPRIDDILYQSKPLLVLNNLKKTGLKDLPAAIRFDSQTTLRDVGLDAYDAANAVQSLSADDDAQAAYEFVDHHLRGIDMENTREFIDRLQKYDDVGSEMRERLAAFSEFSQSDIDTVLSGCTLYGRLQSSHNTHDQTHAELAGLRIWQHRLTGILTNIEFPGERTAGDSNFMEVSEHYVNQ